MKNKSNKNKNSNTNIQDGSVSEGNPEIQDNSAAGNSSNIQESADARDSSDIQDNANAADSTKSRTPFFQGIFRKLKGGKVPEDIPEIQGSIVPEEEPEVRESIIPEEKPEIPESTDAGDIPEIRTPFFQRIFRKLKGGKVSEEILEVQKSVVPEEKPEVQENTDAGDMPEIRTPFFQRIFRKLKGSKVSEEISEVQGGIAVEEKPEVQESITPEEKPEIQESTAAGDISEVKIPFFQRIFRKLKGGKASEEIPETHESIAVEEKPEVLESITPEEKPEVQENITPEEKPEIQESTAAGDISEVKIPFFQRIFRKSKGRKVSEEIPEVQESIAAEEKPEVAEIVVPEEKPEIQENVIPEEKPEIQESTEAGVITESGKSFFQRIFRRHKVSKVSEEIPEVQESITAEEKPEVAESIIPEEIPEVLESVVPEEIPEVQEISEETKYIYLKKKKPWKLAKKIIISFASVLILALLTAGLYALSIFYNPNPLQGFDTIAEQMTTPSPTVLPQPSASEGLPTPSPTVDPYDVLLSQADQSILKDTVNILLIGVDHGDERDKNSWSGKHAWHSDVMIVVAINTVTNKVSLISLPRDTYAKIPGVKGIYKLNAALNCGGGWPKDKAFKKVCDAASWMIGGIPIDYYYAVDFTAVKGLVDAIGGVDFKVDIEFKINGRKYKKGMQHMDGQAALDYMRVRKDAYIAGSGDDGDLNRIDRQKRMLVEIFNKLKSTGTIFSLPSILSAFEGNFFTNVDTAKTAGLAAYAYKNIDPEAIKVHSMDGHYALWLFDWHFVITDPDKRVSIIKKVYGVDISKDKEYKDIYSEYRKYSHNRAWSLWFNMQTEVALKKSKSLLSKAKKILDADAAPAEPPADPSTSPPAVPAGLSAAALLEGSKYGDKERQLYEKAEKEYAALKKCKSSDSSDKRKDLIEKYKKDVQALCKALKIKVKNWDTFWQVVYNAKKGRGVNQHYVKNAVYVDFR